MLKHFGIEGIYVVHALRGYKQHENRIIELFNKNNLEFEFVTDGDLSLFDKDLQEKYFTADIDTKLSKGSQSCTLNHIKAYEKIVKNKNKYALVFEDDPLFLGNFYEKMKRLHEGFDHLEKGFIISLENTTLRFPSYWVTEKGTYLYQATAGRAAGAYIIDFEGATRILNYLKENKCPTIIDWWHNNLIAKGIVKMYWAHPPLVEQCSHNGQMSSTISSKPDTLSRRISWLLQKLYKMKIRRLFNEKRVLSKNKSNKNGISSNPER